MRTSTGVLRVHPGGQSPCQNARCALLCQRLNWGRAILTALALLVWFPASGHCVLMAALSPEPLEDCCDEAPGSGDTSLPDGCSCTKCVTLETGVNSAVFQVLMAASPMWRVDETLTLVLAASMRSEMGSVGPFAEPPRRSVAEWIFVARTALPVRAPSIA